MKIYVAHEFELFEKKGKYETLNPKTFKEVVKVSELRELLEKRKAHYMRQRWFSLVEEMDSLLAELSDKKKEERK
jgi:hypothetical protein